jgi:predicted SAM-dependent methyltransferase
MDNKIGMKLNLGSGVEPIAGYVNIDKYHLADVQEDAVYLPTYAKETVKEIRAHHLLEHLSRDEAPVALRRWHELLVHGGSLIVIVPDVAFNIRLWLESYDRRDPKLWGFRSQTIWGTQVHPGEFHKWGYTLEDLQEVLEDAGFQVYSLRHVDGFDEEFGYFAESCLRADALKT